MFKKINKVVVLLTVSDVFTWGLFLIITALVGLYLQDRFESNIEQVIGIGIALNYMTKTLTEIPIGKISDKIKNDKDDIIFLASGNFLMGLPFIALPYVDVEWQYYGLQVIFGLGASLNLVNWRKIFAKNLDKDKEGLQYAMYDTVMSFFMMIFSLTAGYLASLDKEYFDLLMFGIGALMICSTAFVISLFKVDRKF